MYSGYTTQIMSWADETEKNYRNRFSLLLLLMYLCAFFIILFFFCFKQFLHTKSGFPFFGMFNAIELIEPRHNG